MRTRTEIEEQLVRDISSCQTEAAMATTIQELSLHVLLDIRELLIDYLESQQEGETKFLHNEDKCGDGFHTVGCSCAVPRPPKEESKQKCICKYTSGHHTKCPAWVDEGVMKKYVPQPKEIDVEGLLHEYANLVIKNQDMPVTDRELEIINTLKALQQ